MHRFQGVCNKHFPSVLVLNGRKFEKLNNILCEWMKDKVGKKVSC